MAEVPVRREGGREVALWDPFRELEELAGWRPFGDFGPFRRWGFPRLMEEMWGERAGRGVAPALDITESDDEYVVTVELPGVKKEDVTVEVKEGVLTILGEKKREVTKEKGRWMERSYGSFQRCFTLPPDASGDKIDASFRDGVLTLHIAKAEEKKPRTVAIKSG